MNETVRIPLTTELAAWIFTHVPDAFEQMDSALRDPYREKRFWDAISGYEWSILNVVDSPTVVFMLEDDGFIESFGHMVRVNHDSHEIVILVNRWSDAARDEINRMVLSSNIDSGSPPEDRNDWLQWLTDVLKIALKRGEEYEALLSRIWQLLQEFWEMEFPKMAEFVAAIADKFPG